MKGNLHPPLSPHNARVNKIRWRLLMILEKEESGRFFIYEKYHYPKNNCFVFFLFVSVDFSCLCFLFKKKKERLIEKKQKQDFSSKGIFWHIAKKCVFLFSKNPSFYFSKLFNSFPSLIESTKKHRVVALRKPELKSFLEELWKKSSVI